MGAGALPFNLLIKCIFTSERINGIIKIMIDENARIIENKNLNKNYFLLKLEAETLSADSRPGNFVMVQIISDSFEPLLRRAFAIFKSSPPFIWLYYEVVGRGTELLSRLKTGDQVKMLGPLGNFFTEFENKSILMIAGGRGIAPIFYSAEERSRNNSIYLIYGARSKDDLNLLNEIESLKLKDTYFYTDDGSFGKRGFVTTDLKEIITNKGIEITFSCGPEEMFHHLHREFQGSPTENYVSLEAIMGCGFGVCHSCAVKTENNRYKKVCSDGPIFKMEELKW